MRNTVFSNKSSIDYQRLIPAVIYARYSSSGQREESIEGQIRDCRAYAQQNGMSIIGEYVDKALTSRTDKRPYILCEEIYHGWPGRNYFRIGNVRLCRILQRKLKSERETRIL